MALIRGDVYPSTEMQSVYSTVQADCANIEDFFLNGIVEYVTSLLINVLTFCFPRLKINSEDKV